MVWSYVRPGPEFDAEQPPDPPGGLDAMANRAIAIKQRVAARKAEKRGTAGGPVTAVYTPKPETEMKRRQIRQTAARMIAEQGVLRATMQGFMRAVNLRGMSMYYYYSAREELLADIMVQHIHDLTLQVCAAYDRTEAGTAEQRLEAMIGAFLGFALKERNEHRLILRSGDALDERGQAAVRGRYRVLADVYAEVLAAEEPGAAPAVAKVAAMSLAAAMSCAALWFREDGAVGVAAYAHMLAGWQLRGCGSRVPTDMRRLRRSLGPDSNRLVQ
jgi:AcrR family transcriptional regulator